MVKTFLENLHEWKGRLIAYCGGTGVSVFSETVAAKAQQSSELATSSPDITIANLISIGGLVVVIARLIFDIWVHFDKRKQGKKIDGYKTTDRIGR